MKFLLTALALAICSTQALGDATVYCYWGAWANSRPSLGAYGASDLPTKGCTHIIYTFLFVSAEGELSYQPEEVVNGKSNKISDLIAIKEQNPDLKFNVAVGGWSAESLNFSIVSNDDTLRAKLVTNLYNFVVDNGFTGLDVDWEYPAARGGAETDKEAFIWLLRDLSALFKPAGLELTIAVGILSSYIETSYNVPAIDKYVDHIILMSYDMHGSWDPTTGVNSPLYPQLTDPAGSSLNSDASVKLWLDNGATASKLLLGVAFYGKTFTLASLNNTRTDAPANGAGVAGPYLQEAGNLAYYEICLAQQEAEWSITEVTGNYVYANNGLQWVGYDNVNTMTAKGAYAKKNGLGGVSIWAIDLDDFSGLCGQKYPLLTAVNNGYNAGRVCRKKKN